MHVYLTITVLLYLTMEHNDDNLLSNKLMNQANYNWMMFVYSLLKSSKMNKLKKCRSKISNYLFLRAYGY